MRQLESFIWNNKSDWRVSTRRILLDESHAFSEVEQQEAESATGHVSKRDTLNADTHARADHVNQANTISTETTARGVDWNNVLKQCCSIHWLTWTRKNDGDEGSE